MIRRWQAMTLGVGLNPPATTESEPEAPRRGMPPAFESPPYPSAEYQGYPSPLELARVVTYSSHTVGWSHALSDVFMLRPEIGYFHSYDAKAFDLGKKNYLWQFGMDVTMRF